MARSASDGHAASITAYRKDRSDTPIDFDALPTVDVDVPAHLLRTNSSARKCSWLSTEARCRARRRLLPRRRRAPPPSTSGLHDRCGPAPARPDARHRQPTSAPRPGPSLAISPTTSPTSSVSRSAAVTRNDRRNGDIVRKTYVFGGSPTSAATSVSTWVFPSLPRPTSTATARIRRSRPARLCRSSLTKITISTSAIRRGFKGGGFDPRGQTSQAPDLNGDHSSMRPRSMITWPSTRKR